MHTFFVVLFDSWIGSGKGARGRGRGKDLEGGGDNVSMATATSLSSLLRILLIRVVGCFFFFFKLPFLTYEKVENDGL